MENMCRHDSTARAAREEDVLSHRISPQTSADYFSLSHTHSRKKRRHIRIAQLQNRAAVASVRRGHRRRRRSSRIFPSSLLPPPRSPPLLAGLGKEEAGGGKGGAEQKGSKKSFFSLPCANLPVRGTDRPTERRRFLPTARPQPRTHAKGGVREAKSSSGAQAGFFFAQQRSETDGKGGEREGRQ